MSFLRGYARKLGVLEYQGTWNASTNTPSLVSSQGTRGAYYIVSVAGGTNLNGITDWDVGDWVVYSGTAWQRIDVADNSRNLSILDTLDFKSLTTPPTVIPVSNGNFSITPTTGFTIVCTGSSASSITATLSNATTFAVGARFHIYNNSSNTLIINNFLGTELFQIYPGSSTFLTLVDNSTSAGSWVFSVSSSGNFTGASPVTCSYSGGATTGRYLEFFPSNASDSSPFIIVTDSLLIGLSISASSNATCTIGVFYSTNLVTPIATVSLSNATTGYVTNLSNSLVSGSQLSVRVISGSANKPGAALYLTSI